MAFGIGLGGIWDKHGWNFGFGISMDDILEGEVWMVFWTNNDGLASKIIHTLTKFSMQVNGELQITRLSSVKTGR